MQKASSQIILSENFEAGFPTPGWTFQTVSGSSWSQNTSNFNAVSGAKSLRCYSVPFANANSWAFTPALTLSSNNLYRISYWYRGSTNSGYSERFKLTIGVSATINDQSTIIHDYSNITNTGFLEGIDTISVSSSGNYNLALNYYSLANQAAIYIDSIVVKIIVPAPCTSAPGIGTVTAPAVVAADSSFTLSLSGNYSLVAGLQFQWQSSQYGASNFQNIAGANTRFFNRSQNANTDYRCVVTCSNSGAFSISNVVSVMLPGWGSLFREKFTGNTNINKHINGMSFLTASRGFVAFIDNIGFTQDSGQTYTNHPVTNTNTNFNGYPVNLTFGFSCNGVHAFSNDSLLVYGDYGAEPAILFSANRGLTWKVVFHQPFNNNIENSFFDMKFPTNAFGVAINQKYIVETTNRGQSWVVTRQIPSNRTSLFAKLSMPSANTGYAAAGDYIYRRIAGSWFELQFSTGLPSNVGLQYNNISFPSESIGYVTRDDNFAIYKTTNAGNNWVIINDTVWSPVQASDLHFINDSTGFASTKYTYNVLKTSNSGLTWELCKKNSDYQYGNYGLNRLFFLNNKTGWVGGRGEYLMLTTTAGNPTLPRAIFNIDTTSLTVTGTVTLRNLSYPYYFHKWYRNGVLFSTSQSASYMHGIFEGRDTLKLIVSNGTDSNTLVQYQEYHPYSQVPVISSFTPNAGPAYTIVTISGIGFNGATKVSFGGIEARSFVVNSNSSITAIVGGGSSGDIAVTTSNGTGTGAGFNFELPAAPVIISFTPEHGPVGSTVSISGNNFNTIAQSNIIYFGKIKAKIISATASQVICSVPAGASFDPISISNISNGLSGYAAKPFNITFSGDAAVTENSFHNVLDIPCPRVNGVETRPIYATSGDLDGDGKNDIIGIIYGGPGDSIYIFKNNSILNHISFQPKRGITNGAVKQGIGIGDLDNDGKLDLVKLKGNGVSVLRNKGNLNFDSPVDFTGPAGIEEIVIRDMDADGRPELIIAGYDESKMCVLRNVTVDSTIAFAPKLEYSTGGSGSRSIAVGDLDGDSKPDVIMSKDNGFSIFRNTSITENITFDPKIDFSIGGIVRIFIVDVNADNKADIAITKGSALSVFKNNSTPGVISFEPNIEFSPGAGPGDFHNFTGDSLPDLLSGSGNYYTSFLSKNFSDASGNINFSSVLGMPTGTTAWQCASDLDGDGKVDFVSVDDANTINTFHFFKNRIGEPVDKIICSTTSNYPNFLNSNLTGAVYQWQLDTGSGFADILNSATYSGVNTNSLTIQTGLSSWYGYKYRCVVDGNYSDVFVLKFQNTWTGSVNSSWENPQNWSCGHIPDEFTDVIIPATNVVINSNVYVRSLIAEFGANIIIHSGYNLTTAH